MPNEWTIDTLKEYLLALRDADQEALKLARNTQIYKDEKANALREQINSERGLYARHEDLKPINERFDRLGTTINDKIDKANESWVREHALLVHHHEEDVQAIRLALAAITGTEKGIEKSSAQRYRAITVRIAVITAGIALLTTVVLATIHFVPVGLLLTGML